MTALAAPCWGLPPGYQENPTPAWYEDDPPAVTGITWQPDVYPLARDLALLAGLSAIVDVGCGHGDKLAALHDEHPSWEFLGLDYGTNIAWCRDQYAWGHWWEHDLEDGLTPFQAPNAVVVCADVVEHLRDPRPLLDGLATSGAPAVVLSTPDRDTTYGFPQLGPPENLCHVREWDLGEIVRLVEDRGLDVVHAALTRSDTRDERLATSTLVVRPRP